MEWVETTAPTVEDASNRALDLLGVDTSDAEIEVLDEGKTGFFGRVKTEARVRARIKPKAAPAKDDRNRGGRRNDRSRGGGRDGGGNRGGKSRDGGQNKGGQNKGGQNKGGKGRDGGDRGGNRDGGGRDGGNRDGGGKKAAAAGAAAVGGAAAMSSRDNDGDRGNQGGNRDGGGRNSGNRDGNRGGNDGGRNRDRNDKRDNRKEPRVDEEFSTPDQEAALVSFVGGLAKLFDPSSTTTTTLDEDNLEAHVNGDDLGLLLGPNGNTLTAVEELSRTAMQRVAAGRRYHRIRVDVDEYKSRRRGALQAFAVKLADDVRENGGRKALEPMNSADRKIVHDAITDVDGVDTISEGDDPRRYVVLVPAGE